MTNLFNYDAIISLGGGSQRGPKCTDLPLWVQRRLELAAFLFKESCTSAQEQKQQPSQPCGNEVVGTTATSRQTTNNTHRHHPRPKLIVLSAGTPHRPNYIDEASGFPVLESTSAAEYLRTVHNIDPSDIWKEQTSLDTIGNAYFLRTSFLDPAPPGRFRRLCVVTSDFHIERTRAVFDWVLGTGPEEGHDKEGGEDDDTVASTLSKQFDGSEMTRRNPTATDPDAKEGGAEEATSCSLDPFRAKYHGTSVNRRRRPRSDNNRRTVAGGGGGGGGIREYDVVDYFSVSDKGTMTNETVLKERVQREQQSLVNFRNGIVKRLEPLLDYNDDEDGGYAFLGALQEFVLHEHKAYCVHDRMMAFPARETWMANETY